MNFNYKRIFAENLIKVICQDVKKNKTKKQNKIKKILLSEIPIETTFFSSITGLAHRQKKNNCNKF